MDDKKRRIIVVDDVPDILDFVCRALEQAGYLAVPAGCGEEALQLCQTTFFDMAILDIMMPGMDGIELGDRIRRHYQIPTIIISAHYNADTLTAAGKLGASGYLAKPFTVAQLTAQVGAVMASLEFNDRRDIQTDLLIEYAKGLVAERRSLTEREAYSWMRENAMEMRVKVAEIARRLALAHDQTIALMRKPRDGWKMY